MFIDTRKQIHIQDLNSKYINKKLFAKLPKKYQKYIISLEVSKELDGNRYCTILTDDKLISDYTWNDFYYALKEYIEKGVEL